MRLDYVATTLKDSELLSTVKALTFQERKTQYQFLCYLSEVDRRKLYATEGYSSLFSFLTDYLGYSESSALKRSQIVRKAEKLPQLYFAIEDGRLSLSVASRLCPYLSEDNFENLVSECERQSVRDVERIIVKYFPKARVNDSLRQRVSPLSVDEVSVRFTADKAFEEKLERAKNLLSHKYPQLNLADILGEALDALLHEKEPKTDVSTEREINPSQSLDSRYIPRGIRKTVWKNDEGQCSYVSPSGTKCSAKRFLQVDHIKPWALGGSSCDASNLRLLCGTHNRLRAKATFHK